MALAQFRDNATTFLLLIKGQVGIMQSRMFAQF